MEFNKVMKIVQAVNDSKGEPVDIKDNYKFISRASGWNSIPENEVHATNASEDGPNKSWQYICTVEEFNQCVKEMSAGYDKKESVMKNNKHPHHDLIVEWAKDTSKIVQILNGDGWCDHRKPSWSIHSEYRFKPREFVKGYWYPCVTMDGDIFIGQWYGAKIGCDLSGKIYEPKELRDIGESLGEINFGGGE